MPSSVSPLKPLCTTLMTLDFSLPDGDLWVFGYGSLMWNPGFEYRHCQRARCVGYRRALCVWSWIHRGTQEQPGLVFGLDRGGACEGLAFCVPHEHKAPVARYLFEREMVTNVYIPTLHTIELLEATTPYPQQVLALLFVVDHAHPQYAGELPPTQAAAVVKQAHGRSGPNPEYVLSTAKHLQEQRIDDHYLEQVVLLLQESG